MFRSVVHFESVFVECEVWIVVDCHCIQALFPEETTLFPSNCLCTFVKNQLIMCVWICSFTLYLVLLINISVICLSSFIFYFALFCLHLELSHWPICVKTNVSLNKRVSIHKPEATHESPFYHS